MDSTIKTIRIWLVVGIIFWLAILALGIFLLIFANNEVARIESTTYRTEYDKALEVNNAANLLTLGLTCVIAGPIASFISLIFILTVGGYDTSTNMVARGIICIIFANIPAGVIMIRDRYVIAAENRI